jgi:hypothetical protein
MSAPIILGGANAEVINNKAFTMEEIREKLPFIKNAKLLIVNPLKDRSQISSDLKNKSGIYC